MATLPPEWAELIEQNDRGCWIWTGPFHKDNPVISGRRGARRVIAEQLGVRITENAGARGPSINVLCGDSRCVSPGHLRWLYEEECPRYDEAAQMFLAMASLEQIAERFGITPSMAWTVIRRARLEPGWVDQGLQRRLQELGSRRPR